MKIQVSNPPAVRQPAPATPPQLTVRSGIRAGLTEDCSLGVSYWRKELNALRTIAQALNCD